jgi:leucyl/phenylalanyl-tRNA--protein transferase
MIDCQTHSEHLERFGAVEIPRENFLQRLETCLAAPTRRGPWTDSLDAFQAKAARAPQD